MKPRHAVSYVRTRQPIQLAPACWAQLRRWGQPAQLVQSGRPVQLGLCSWGQKWVVLSVVPCVLHLAAPWPAKDLPA